MSAFAGFDLRDALLVPFGGYSTTLAPGVELWRLPYKLIGVSDATFGIVTDTQPLDEEERSFGGNQLSSFVGDYYNRIHILPGTLNLGAVLGNQTRLVEVWNAYFDPHAFLSVKSEDASGTVLTPLTDTAPTTMGPLQSLRYNLTIYSAGPATLNAAYVFEFDVGTFDLGLTGRRTSVFAFPPNWTQPVVERLAWLTRVLRSLNGKEQRIAGRLIPRRQLEYTLAHFEENYQLLDSLFAGWQGRSYAFPFWPDAQILFGDLSPGALEINCNTKDLDFFPGGYVIVTSGPTRAEAIEIAEVLPTKLILERPVERLWRGRTILVPGRVGRLVANVEMARSTAKLGTGKVVFEVEDIQNAIPMPTGALYEGQELFMKAPNRAEDVTVEYSRLMDRIDYGDGVVTNEDRAKRSFAVRSYDFLLGDRPEMTSFRSWLHVRQGQLKPFWMPVWECNMEVVRGTTEIDGALTVAAGGFSSMLSDEKSRRHIAVHLRRGAWKYFEVTQFGEGETEDEELVFLNRPFGEVTQIGDIDFVTFMDFAVLNADEVEISYLSTEAATARLATRSVIA